MGEFTQSYYIAADDDTHSVKVDKTRCMCLDYDTNERRPIQRCRNKVVPGYHFCDKHFNCAANLSEYRSGAEPVYAPQEWRDKYIEGSHNCYSYFLNSKVQAVREKCQSKCANKSAQCPKENSECSELKPQPGDHHLIKTTGSAYEKDTVYRCPQLERKILKDNEMLVPVPFHRKCPANFFKGAMVVDRDHTFHFYRQDSNGQWSHKPGISPVSNNDATSRPIYIPHIADRNYARDKSENKEDDAINYTDFCGYYCIPDANYTNIFLA